MALLIDIPQITDSRGTLCFAQWKDLPFEPQRVFWIYGVGQGQTRGGHAHSLCAEVVFPVCGSFDMFVDDGQTHEVVRMDSPARGIFIGKGVWCELRNFSPDAVVVVLASCEYMKDGYINDYEEFVRWVKLRV